VKARQDAFGMFLKSGMDYLLFVDSDMVLGPPGILDHMISVCPDRGIIGGLYAKKALDSKGHAPVNGTGASSSPIDKLDGSVIEIDNLPTGFMLIPRGVAEKMAEKYENLAYIDHDIGKTWAVFNCILMKDQSGIVRFMSEDYSFCVRARAAGIKIYADTAAMIGHIGQYLYHIEHLRVQC